LDGNTKGLKSSQLLQFAIQKYYRKLETLQQEGEILFSQGGGSAPVETFSKLSWLLVDPAWRFMWDLSGCCFLTISFSGRGRVIARMRSRTIFSGRCAE